MPNIAAFVRKVYFPLVSLLCLIGVIGTGAFSWRTSQDQDQRQQASFEFGSDQAERVATEVNAEMNLQMTIAETIAGEISDGTLAYTEITGRLRDELDAHPNFFGMGVAFLPYVYKSDLKLFAPYYFKNEFGNFTRAQVETDYDYSDRATQDNEWFYSALEDGAYWYASEYDITAQAELVEYITPFYRTNPQTGQQEAVGVVWVDHSVETMKSFIRSIDVGEDGYTTLIESAGYIVVHPKAEYINKTLYEVAELVGDTELSAAADRAISGEDFYLQRKPTVNLNSTAWTFFKPLIAEGWSIAVTVSDNVFEAPPEELLRTQIWLSIMIMTALISLALLIFRVDEGAVRNLWIVVGWSTFVLLSGVMWMWQIVNTNPSNITASKNILVSTSVVNESLKSVDETATINGRPIALRIPTGVLVQNIQIQPNEAVISGYLWQKYPKELPPNFMEHLEHEFIQGVEFPDDTGATAFEESYRFQRADSEIVGWFFTTTLHQAYNTAQYPLDQANIQIRISPQYLDQNIVLVPDFESYDFVAPSSLPGLSPQINIPDWNIQRSFFSYQLQQFNTNFGSQTHIQRNNLPTLTFNISASRNLLSPIIAFCITIIVVAGLMFGSLIVKLDSAYSALSNAAALFFVVAITHVGLRGSIAAGGTVYLEYFFIVLYIFILGLALDGLMYYNESAIPIISYGENLIPKLCFGPGLAITFLAITIFVFYPRTVAADPLQEYLSINALQATEEPAASDLTPTASPVTDSGSAANNLTATPIRPSTSPAATTVPVILPEDPITLRYPFGLEPPTLDPSLVSLTSDQDQVEQLFIGLTRLESGTNTPLPNLAASWTTSEDGLTWTFHLRNDIPWVQYNAATNSVSQVTDFNGTPRFVNAYDVVYGIHHALTSENTSAALLYEIKNAEQPDDDLGVKALDEWTLEITLNRPAPYFASIVAYDVSYPVPGWAIEEWDKEWIAPENIVTNGPFVLASWEKGKGITLLKNPLWPEADKIQIERVEEILVQDGEIALKLYRDNQIDTLGGLRSNILQEVKSDPTLANELSSHSNLCVRYFGFTNTKPPFDDPRVRRAFSAAVNRQEIVEMLKVGNIPAFTFAPPGIFGAVTDPGVGQGFDADLAKQLFQEYLDERGFTIADFNSAYPLVMGQLNGLNNSASDIAIKNWNDILGVTVTTKTVETAEFQSSIAKDTPIKNAFSMFQWAWCADYPDQNDFLHVLFNSETGTNLVRRNCADETCTAILPNDEFDNLTLMASQINDPEERQRLYAQAEHILVVEEAALAPIYYGASTSLTKPWLTRNFPNMGAPDFMNWIIDILAQKTTP